MSGISRASRPSRGRTVVASSPWIVVFAGVVVMVVLLVVALGAYRGRSPAPDAAAEPYPAVPLPLPPSPASPTAGSPTPPTSPPPTPTPTPPALPGLSPRATGLPTRSPVASPTSAGAVVSVSARPPARPAPPQPPAVTGRYRVVQSFDGGFIGEVLISNAAGDGRSWTARLGFPGGRLVTAWVEGMPQGTAREFDGGFTYTSGAEVPAGGTATLRFHIERAATKPSECRVDSFGCAGV
ncbi:cellulose-binding protein [Micromonospora sp. GCM10011542]|uniref:cellulose-binding protein n=1 Tax=Micromonospora sp. GCM10011542 TaxID=3317337 RepID=UPI00360D04D1